MVKILVPEPGYFPEEAIQILKRVGDVAIVGGRAELLEEAKDADVLVIRVGTKIDKQVLDNAEKLKVIATATAGVDHIDLIEAGKRGIKVINLEGGNTQPTAEYTIALLFSLARKIPWAFEHMKKGFWERDKFFGIGLGGRTLGIVGFGKIGSKVAAYAQAFGMKVIAHDPYVNAEKIPEAGAENVSFEELLQRSDIITIHSLLTKETENMIGEKEFENMKNGSFLVNVARGRIVDEKALLAALKTGKLAGAALDVYSIEPLGSKSELLNYAVENNNLLLTPHMGASTNESVMNSAVYIAKKVEEIFCKSR